MINKLNIKTPQINNGFMYKDVFSPTISLSDLPKRMEKRIHKVRKMIGNNIFSTPYKK
ncbi:MAG: hypothetical protein J6Y53_01230 [Alphaproteobacteria bacterium]|nr:hypothetical protein [Alphaproteobacteria bacterium]